MTLLYQRTKPDPNPAVPFVRALKNSGIILNARMVGSPEIVKETTKKLWNPGMKLIAVTFSQTPEVQKETFEILKKSG